MSLFLTNGGASLVLATGGIPVLGSSPLERGEHPRIWIQPDGYTAGPTVSDVKTLVVNDVLEPVAGTSLKDEFQAVVTAMNATYGNSTYTPPEVLNWAFLYLTYDEGNGINYGGRSQADYGSKARATLLAQIASTAGHDVGYYWDFIGSYEATSMLAVAADWIWPLLSSDVSTLGDFAKRIPTSMVAENQMSLANSQRVAQTQTLYLWGLTLAGSGYDNPWAQGLVDSWETWFRGDQGFATAQSVWGSDGGWLQGLLYGLAYSQVEMLAAEEAYRTSHNISKAAHYAVDDVRCLRSVGRLFTNITLPDAYPRSYNAAKPDGYAWIFWKAEKVSWPDISPVPQHRMVSIGVSADIGINAALGNTSAAALSRWYLAHRVGTSTPLGTQYWVFSRLWSDWSVSEQSPDALGLDLGQAFGQGLWALRSRWDETIGDPIVIISANQYMAGPSYPAGSIFVHRKGPVAFRRGGVSGHDSINNERAAANVMIFPNVALDWTTMDDGGRWMERPLEGATRRQPLDVNHISDYFAADTAHDMTGERRFLSATPEQSVHYLFMDLTRAYSCDAIQDYQDASHISEYVRQIAYFIPGDPQVDPVILVIHDRATVKNNTTYEKRFIWNPAGTPGFVDGTVSAGPNRGPTGTNVKTQSTDATCVTVTNTANGADNKQWITPLLPATRTVAIIGGAGDTGLTFQGGASISDWSTATSHDSHEFENPYGVYIPHDAGTNETPSAYRFPYVGTHHVEVIAANALTENFLTVVEVGDSDDTQSTTTAITGSGFEGARVGSGIAVFGNDGFTKTSGSFTIPSAGTYTLMVAGLNPNTTRVLDPDANGTISGLSAGESSSADSGTSGTRTVTITTSASCVVTVS